MYRATPGPVSSVKIVAIESGNIRVARNVNVVIVFLTVKDNDQRLGIYKKTE
jgi:hypothetical protein